MLPVAASARSIATPTPASPPWIAPPRRPRPVPKALSKPPEPKNAEKMSATEPNRSKFGAIPPDRSPSWP